MIKKKINNSFITFYKDPPIHIREYYNHCLNLLEIILNNSEKNFHIVFGDLPKPDDKINKVIRIDIQCEHTIVKQGGRGVSDIIFGDVPTGDGDNYLVRIDRYDYFKQLDYIIEYSYPNLHNILLSEKFYDFSKKIIVVEPILVKPNFFSNNRKDSISIFTKNGSSRRDLMYEKLTNIDSEFKNISNCFSQICLNEIYQNTKIMVNVHQTDHHHTFEELRVLPALAQGVLVISENVPLKEKIPYYESIIWSSYDDIPKKLIEVQKNYKTIYNNVFNGHLLKTIENLNSINITHLSKILN